MQSDFCDAKTNTQTNKKNLQSNAKLKLLQKDEKRDDCNKDTEIAVKLPSKINTLIYFLLCFH